MNKFALLKIVNPILILSFIVQAVTGLAMAMELNVPFLGFMADAHRYNGTLMTLLVLTHVYLNWSWIAANILKSNKPSSGPR